MVNNTQLSLLATVETTYKVGDRVKLRKKPKDAFSLKKGDVVKIAVVHPLEGSIKFWALLNTGMNSRFPNCYKPSMMSFVTSEKS